MTLIISKCSMALYNQCVSWQIQYLLYVELTIRSSTRQNQQIYFSIECLTMYTYLVIVAYLLMLFSHCFCLSLFIQYILYINEIILYVHILCTHMYQRHHLSFRQTKISEGNYTRYISRTDVMLATSPTNQQGMYVQNYCCIRTSVRVKLTRFIIIIIIMTMMHI